MNFKHTVLARSALALVVVAAISGCKGKDEYAAGDVATNRDSTAAKLDTNAMSPPASTAPATNAWTSSTILGFALAANSGEVELGKLGEAKATDPAVKAFAKQMVTDHQAMFNDVKSLASKVAATTDTSSDNARDLLNHGRDEVKDLTDKAIGKEWDDDYISKMIDDHQKVLDKLQDAAKNATDPEIRSALEKASGKVQQHLTKAQDIAAKRKA